MRILNLGVASLLVVIAGQVRADENSEVPAQQINAVSERDVVHAMEVLAKAKVIVLQKSTENLDKGPSNLRLNTDLLEKLRAEGKLDNAYAGVGGLCY